MTDQTQLTCERNAAFSAAAHKRAAIEAELRADPSRSNREIGRVCQADHKTVATRRRKMGLADPLGNSQATPNLLQTVAVTLTDTGLDTSDPTVFPILTAAANRDQKTFNPFDPKEECLIAQERQGLAVFVNTRNNVVIANGNERDGIDEMVQVTPIDLPALIRQLGEIQSEFADGVSDRSGADAG